MASEETDIQTERGRGSRSSARPVTDGKPGLLRLLWADIRKQQIYSEPDPFAEEAFEVQQETRREHSAKIGHVHSLGPEHYDRMRKNYWGS